LCLRGNLGHPTNNVCCITRIFVDYCVQGRDVCGTVALCCMEWSGILATSKKVKKTKSPWYAKLKPQCLMVSKYHNPKTTYRRKGRRIQQVENA